MSNRCKCQIPRRANQALTPPPAAIDKALTNEVMRLDQKEEILTKPDLGDRYEPLELIGKGGMGYVWKIRDNAINKTLAVKLLRAELCQDKAALKRFEQEASATISLTQVNLCPVYGCNRAPDNTPFIIMDYLEGDNLADFLKKEICLASNLALDIAIQTCEALSHAHSKGIVHRDLKPSNIILTKNTTGNFVVKVVDFGIAKLMPPMNEQTNNLTQTGELFGSPLYMSPEQCKGELVDGRSDIYSLGCLMYEMVTGNPPFLAANPIRIILKHLEEEPRPLPHSNTDSKQVIAFQQIILHCLEKDPKNRYQTVDTLLKDLNLITHGSTKLQSTIGKWKRKPPSHRNKTKRLLLFSIMALMSLSTIAVLLLITPELRILTPIMKSLYQQQKFPWFAEVERGRELSSLNIDKATIHYRKAINIAEKCGASSQEIANIKYEFGAAIFSAAPHEAYRLLAYCAKHEEPDNPRHANTLEYLSRLETIEAEMKQVEAIKMRRKEGDYKAADNLEAEANSLQKLAREQAEQAIKIKIKGLSTKDHEFVEDAFRSKGQVLYRQHLYTEAEAAYLEALAIARKLNLDDGATEAARLYNLAGCCENQGKMAQAKSYYLQSIEKYTQVLGPEHKKIKDITKEYQRLFRK